MMSEECIDDVPECYGDFSSECEHSCIYAEDCEIETGIEDGD